MPLFRFISPGTGRLLMLSKSEDLPVCNLIQAFGGKAGNADLPFFVCGFIPKLFSSKAHRLTN